MSKHDDKLEQKSQAKHEIKKESGALDDKDLEKVTGGGVSEIVVTKRLDKASTKLWND